MVTVRGTNVYPTAVENLLGETEGVSPYYQMVLDREGANDKMTVEFEPEKNVAEADWPKLAEEVAGRIHKALHVRLEITPLAPTAIIGTVRESSPQSTVRPVAATSSLA